MAQYTDMALQYSRLGLDKRAATLFGKWHQNRFGQDVQQFVGVYHPDNSEYVLTDQLATPDPWEYANQASDAAATRKGKPVPIQFDKDYPYKSQRGEPSDPTEDLLREAGAALASWVFDAVGLESLARGSKRIIRGDRLANQKILKQNLISRWRNEGAAMELLRSSALRSSPIGQLGPGQRPPDAASNFTTAGFSNPLHNINVDGWNRDYKLRFFKAMGIGDGGSFASKPSLTEVISSAKLGTNLGQMNPFNEEGKFVWKPAEPLYNPPGETQGGLNAAISNWINSIFAPPPVQPDRLTTLQAELKNMKEVFMQNLGPGPRIPVTFRVAINLSDLLQQNLIIPPDMTRNNHLGDAEFGYMQTSYFGGDPGKALAAQKIFSDTELTTDPTDAVFRQLYLQNANPINVAGMIREGNKNVSASNLPKRKPAGIIAGIPVADLQSPVLDNKAGLYAPDDSHPVFEFKEDYKNNNLDNIARGFGDNTPANKATRGLGVAVTNDPIKPFEKNHMMKTIGIGNSQIFPFMFETINKTGSKRTYTPLPVFHRDEAGKIKLDQNGDPIFTETIRGSGGKEYKQFAFFQATLNSISESYNPTWSSKHFFGRTEQIHSYTMTDRTFEVSFSITVDEIRKLQHLYERVLWLAQQTYASYDENGRMKAGPLIRMTIGDMFAGMTGFLRSLSYDWNYLGGGSPKWEITQGLRIPMACNVSLSFTVIHDVLPDRNYNFYPGPMLQGPDKAGGGMVSERGLTPFEPWATGVAPLISVADSAEMAQERSDVHEVAMTNYRNEMYIWQAYGNAIDSSGIADTIY